MALMIMDAPRIRDQFTVCLVKCQESHFCVCLCTGSACVRSCIFKLWRINYMGECLNFKFLMQYILLACEVITKKDVCFEGTKNNACNFKIRL